MTATRLDLLAICRDRWPILLILAVFLYFLKEHFHHRLDRIPGPFKNSCTPFFRIISVWSGKSQLHDLELHRQHGKLVRVAPRIISVADPNEIDHIYGVSSKFYKSRFFDPVRFYDDEGLIPDPLVLTDKAMHSRMKRSAANAFALNALIQIEPLFDGVLDRLLTLLETQHANTGVPCDMTVVMQCFAMDSVVNITFGRDLQFLESEKSRYMMGALDKSLKYLSVVGQIPWVHKFLLGNSYYSKYLQGNNAIVDEIFSLSFSETEAALKDLGERDGPCTFLQRLLLNQSKNPSSATDREISTHTFGNVTAGSDTTATALRAVIIEILKAPRVYSKLTNEIRQAGLETPVSFAVANKLPYLGAVIKEAIRLHPSVQLILGRTVPSGGAMISGKYVPGGTEVGINPFIIHRDPKVFPNPESFNPDRWLTNDQKELGHMNRTFFAFGSGAHTCSGRHISIMEITKCIAAMLLRFDLSFADPDIDAGGITKGLRTQNFWIAAQKGLKVAIKHIEEIEKP